MVQNIPEMEYLSGNIFPGTGWLPRSHRTDPGGMVFFYFHQNIYYGKYNISRSIE